jgi:hypothetical protein
MQIMHIWPSNQSKEPFVNRMLGTPVDARDCSAPECGG